MGRRWAAIKRPPAHSVTEDVSTSAAPAGAPDRGSDVWWAAGAGLVALIVYIRTLAPGLTDDVDTAMFQFIGRVLGVAHNPGYPLYVLLTHGFSWVPVGSLASPPGMKTTRTFGSRRPTPKRSPFRSGLN